MNPLLILGAGVANWAIGAVWYGAFGNAWLAALGKRKEQLDPRDPRPYLVALAGSLLNAWGLSIALRWIPPTSLGHAALLGLGAWLLLVAATSAKHYAFAGWPRRLFAIDLGCDLVGFVAMALILALGAP